MDFKTLTTTPEDLATLRSDALVVVVPADKAHWRLPKPLAEAVNDAVKHGDLELKAGKTERGIQFIAQVVHDLFAASCRRVCETIQMFRLISDRSQDVLDFGEL